jgi:hypothetical protein
LLLRMNSKWVGLTNISNFSMIYGKPFRTQKAH